MDKHRILARAKEVDGCWEIPRTVILDSKNLAKLFGLPLHEAAKELGVCDTALKT